MSIETLKMIFLTSTTNRHTHTNYLTMTGIYLKFFTKNFVK